VAGEGGSPWYGLAVTLPGLLLASALATSPAPAADVTPFEASRSAPACGREDRVACLLDAGFAGPERFLADHARSPHAAEAVAQANGALAEAARAIREAATAPPPKGHDAEAVERTLGSYERLAHGLPRPLAAVAFDAMGELAYAAGDIPRARRFSQLGAMAPDAEASTRSKARLREIAAGGPAD